MLSLACTSVRLGFFFQAEDGIRDLVRSRGLGDVYKRQLFTKVNVAVMPAALEGYESYPSGELLALARMAWRLSLIHI